MNPNKTNNNESDTGNQPTGWEIVEAEAGKMNTSAQGPVTEHKNQDTEQKSNILAALRERIKHLTRVEIVHDGGTSKNGGTSFHAVKMPFGRKIGTGVLSEDFDDDDAAILNAVYVNPKYRGRGIGGAIVDEAISQARKEGLRSVNIDSTEMAVGMYKKRGFKVNEKSDGGMSLDLGDTETKDDQQTKVLRNNGLGRN